tara:strand:+ start:89168 stop:90187 length:1020 start_codon:yes stop_codon:yes gene_type:complete
MSKIRTLLICPGRGSYTKSEVGYLKLNKKYNMDIIDWIDKQRESKGLTKLKELDLISFKSSIHTSGENASPLIYACSISDFLSLNKKNFDFVCIIGNSMGWYTALALSGAVSLNNSYKIVQNMGSIMDLKGVGAQLIYPIIDDNWQIDEELLRYITNQVKKTKNFISIKLGGYVIIGGKEKSIEQLSNILPKKGVFPHTIPYHAAFHTPLLKKISSSIKKVISPSIFSKPSIPLVDGCGRAWSPFSTNSNDLWSYTFGEQILDTFDFTSALGNALKEWCPEKIILLGPGNSLGGPIGQILIKNKWLGYKSKKEFSFLQKVDPYLLSMGQKEQRAIIENF